MTAVYWSEPKVREDRIEALETILRFARGEVGMGDLEPQVAALLRGWERVARRLGEAYIQGGYLVLGALGRGDLEEALFLSRFVEPGEVLVFSHPDHPLGGFLVLKEGEVWPLLGALVSEGGQVVWTL